ncbi:MAG: amidase [Tunicatimonas sp.]
MLRRNFLYHSLLGSTTLLLPALSACEPTTNSAPPNDASDSPASFPLEEITIPELREGMESGEYTARAITEMYLDRIKAIDQSGPTLRSVIEVNPDALSIADQLDEERKQGQLRGPLHGIPVMLKDNIDTDDQMETTAGSLALVGMPVAQDAWVTQRLRAAGAVILGKTNLSEWANFRSERSSSGWSGRGGQTKNPYVLDRNPCGSSAGSGVAVSANLCAVAIGTETNGSIVCPSTTNGIVGIKPTVGLVGRSGIVPISHTQDTAGPMARTVTDAAIVLGTLTGTDPRDAVTKESTGKASLDYTQFLQKDGLRGARLGLSRQHLGFHEDVDALIDAALDTMREQGAEVVDVDELIPDGAVGNAEYQVLLYEFKEDLNRYLATRGGGDSLRTLSDLIAFNKEHAAEEMPYFQQEIMLQAEAKGGLDAPDYRKALGKIRRLSRDEGIDRVLRDQQLDAILAPTGGPAWPTDLLTGDHFLGGSSSPAAMAGYPSITVPMGFVHGLPVGISFFAGAYREPTLIELAYAYEQATIHRRAPEFLETLNLG